MVVVVAVTLVPGIVAWPIRVYYNTVVAAAVVVVERCIDDGGHWWLKVDAPFVPLRDMFASSQSLSR